MLSVQQKMRQLTNDKRKNEWGARREKKKTKTTTKKKPKRTIVCLKLFFCVALWLLSFVILHFATCDYFGNGRYGNLAGELMLITVFRLFAILWMSAERKNGEVARFDLSFERCWRNGRFERSVVWPPPPQNKEQNANVTTNKNYSNKFPFSSLVRVPISFPCRKPNETKWIPNHLSTLFHTSVIKFNLSTATFIRHTPRSSGGGTYLRRKKNPQKKRTRKWKNHWNVECLLFMNSHSFCRTFQLFLIVLLKWREKSRFVIKLLCLVVIPTL